jgi:hypothetical protein
MIFKTISCKKVKNLGNYQSEHLEAFAELDPTDDPDECALKLRKFVDDSLSKPLEVKEPHPSFSEDF